MTLNPKPSVQISASDARKVSIQQLLILLLGITLLFSLGNQALPLIDRDEPRFAEASREMMQAGNWVVPSFNNAPRYDKPPLIYWMQIACYKTLGINEFSARFPAAICTALTAVALVLWGARVADPPTGWRAAIIYCLCLQVFMHGRAAVADPPLVLFCTLAAWAGWEWLRNPQGLIPAACFWLSLAFGFLAKGPVAWIPIGMVILQSLRQRKEGLPSPKPALWIWGCVVMLVLICLWGIPALIQTNGEFAAKGLGKHVVGRSLIAMEGHGAKSILGYIATLPLYFLTVFASFFPWSIWLPSGFRFHRNTPSPEARYLISGVLLTFAIFTFSRTKLPHYTLPCFPLLALLIALWWKHHKSSKLFRKTALLTAAAFTTIPIFVFPYVGPLSASEKIAAAVFPELEPGTSIALCDYQEPSLIWNLRKKTGAFAEMISLGSSSEWLSRPGKRILILTADSASKVQGAWTRKDARGLNFAKGKPVSLVALSPSSQTPPGRAPANLPANNPESRSAGPQ